MLVPPPGKRLRDDKLTCSTRCRTARRRRVNKEARQIDPTRDGRGTAALQRSIDTNGKKAPDAVQRAVQEELRPVVREQITEDTLRAIRRLVALTPVMVEAIGRDLEHPDPVIRQRAYSVMARYTLGHSAIVTPPEDATRQTMTVIFPGMVRPGQDSAIEGTTAPPVDEPPRTCNSCDATKPAVEFVEHSDRCKDCHAEMQERMQEVVGDALA